VLLNPPIPIFPHTGERRYDPLPLDGGGQGRYDPLPLDGGGQGWG